jgi:diguanylate cyclase (GGDEF)-like protein
MEKNKKPRLIVADTDSAFSKRIEKELAPYYEVETISDYNDLQRIHFYDDLEMLLISEHLPALTSKEFLDKLFSLRKYPWVFAVKVCTEKSIYKILHAMDEGYHFVIEKELSHFQLIASLLSLHKLREISNKATRLIYEFKGRAEKDPLTKLFNRAVFFDYSHREFSRSRRNNFPLSVIMIDIDHFKKLNQQLGHLGGDFILVQFANFLMNQLREYDFISRFGGDEFIITLPHTDLHQAVQVGEKLQGALRKASFIYNDHPVDFTISLGLASLSDTPEATSLKQLISYADKALYAAKEKGRDYLCAYSDL